MKKVNKNGSTAQFNKGAKPPANFSNSKAQPKVSKVVNKGAPAPTQFMKLHGGEYDVKDNYTNEFADKGRSAGVKRAERANKTSYGSRSVGADIDGGYER